MTVREALRRYPLFALTPPVLLDDWLSASPRVAFPMGETLFQEGSQGEWAYLLVKGRVRVVRTTKGKEATQSVLQPGQLFGEYALVQPGRNTATCRAASDVEVIRIPLAPVRRWFEHAPGPASFPKSWLQLHPLVSKLRGQPYLGFMSAASALAMEPHLIPLEVGPMRTLQTVGLCDDWWLYIQQGEVQIETRKGLRDLGPGDFLGERALSGEPDLPTAVTLTATRCLGLPRSFFLRPQQSPVKPEQSYVAHTLAQPSRVRWIGQREASDCGPASLAMIAHYHDMPLGLDDIRTRVSVGPLGLSALELLEAARTLRFAGQAVRVSLAQMMHVQVPALVHVDERHYVVLFRLNDTGAYLGDPATGLVTISLPHFAARCSGRMLLLRPSEEPGFCPHR